MPTAAMGLTERALRKCSFCGVTEADAHVFAFGTADDRLRQFDGTPTCPECLLSIHARVSCQRISAAADFRDLRTSDVLLVDPGAEPMPGDVLADLDGNLATHPDQPPGELVGVVVDLIHRDRSRL